MRAPECRVSGFRRTVLIVWLPLIFGLGFGIVRASPLVPMKFRDEPAVVLDEERSWDVRVKGDSTYRVKRRILIQHRRAFDLADQYVTYGRSGSTLKGFGARTILPGGEVIEVPDDLKTDRVLYREGDHEVGILQFTFPAVAPGVVLEWEYEIESQDLTWFRLWRVQRDIPVMRSRFIASSHKSKKYDYRMKVFSRVPYEPWCSVDRPDTKGGTRSLIIDCRELPPHETERRSPPEEDTRLVLAVSISSAAISAHLRMWDRLHDEWAEQIDEFLAEDEQTRALARTLVEGAESDGEKIDRIYEHVQREFELRDSFANEGLEGERGEAESVDDVLRRGGGPADELTLLTLALLRAAGIQTDSILVQDSTDGKLVWAYPSFTQVDHLMLRLEVDGKEGFLDPACRECQPGIPDWRYCSVEKNGIVVRTNQTIPQKISVGEIAAEINGERRTGRVELEADGSARVSGSVSWHGQRDVDYRRRWQDRSESGRRDAFVRSLPGRVSNVSAEIADPEDPYATLQVDYEYRRSDQALAVEQRLLIRPDDVFSRRLYVPIESDREYPVRIRYPFAVRSETRFALPDGFEAPELPGKTQIEGPGAEFRCRWRIDEATGELVWTGLLSVTRTEFAVEEYRALLEFTTRLRQTLLGGLTLTRSNRGES